MRRETEIFQVDAFTEQPYQGNPAGVCLLDEPAIDSWMQNVAREMNLSETAFLTRSGHEVEVRYFTPEVEVPICGHATLASAHILWEQGLVELDRDIVFHAKAGQLYAKREGNWLCLDFPAKPVTPVDVPAGMEEAMGVSLAGVHQIKGGGFLLELESEEAVRALRPDFSLIRQGRFGGIIATARSSSPLMDFVSRFFHPEIGINEDPVTGVAHCSLGPFWSQRLGKAELDGYQASARGGFVRVRPKGDRVDILGKAVTVIHGRVLQ
jgi:PhzF family phenazine biosynthesis protein